MRFSLLLIITFTFVISLFGGEQTSDINEAKKISTELGKPILIDFMTDW